MTNFRVTNNNQNTSSVKKYLKYSTLALSSVALGYLYGINKFEKYSYKTNFAKLQIIDELKNCCKELTLKTKQNLEIKALDINPSNSDKYIIFCNGMFTTMDSKNQKIYTELLKTKRGVIAFDYPGRGESITNFSQKNALQSLESVHNYLLQIWGELGLLAFVGVVLCNIVLYCRFFISALRNEISFLQIELFFVVSYYEFQFFKSFDLLSSYSLWVLFVFFLKSSSKTNNVVSSCYLPMQVKQ